MKRHRYKKKMASRLLRHTLTSAMCVLITPTVNPSTAVGVWSAQSAVLVVDSKALRYDGKQLSVCKLVKEGNCAATVVGIGSYEAADGFSLATIVRDACRDGGTIAEIVEKFSTRLRPALKRVLPVIRRHNRNWYDTYFVNHVVAEVIFGGVDKGVPLLIAHSAYLKDNGELLEYRTSLPNERGSTLLLSGHVGPIQAYIKHHSGRLARMDVQTLGRELLGAAITSAKSNSGSPLSMVEVRPSGLRWVEVGLCANDTSP